MFALQCRKTKPEAGDGIDNDCDGKVDEEIRNGKDDDGDGFVDEDITTVLLLFGLDWSVFVDKVPLE